MKKKQASILYAESFFSLAGYSVFHPLKKPLGFDFIAYKDDTFYKILVRPTTYTRGYYVVSLTTSFGRQDRTLITDDDFDILIAVVFEKNICYRFDKSDLPNKKSLTLSDRYLDFVWHPGIALLEDEEKQQEVKRLQKKEVEKIEKEETVEDIQKRLDKSLEQDKQIFDLLG